MTKPDFTKITSDVTNFEKRFRDALYYNHYEINPGTLKKETIKWAKEQKVKTKELEQLKEPCFATIGKYCYILNKGGELPKKYKEGFHRLFELLCEEAKEKYTQEESTVKKATIKNKPNIQERMKEQAAEVASVFDGAIDDYIVNENKSALQLDTLSQMKSNNLKHGHMRFFEQFYEHDLQDYEQLLSKTPPEDLKEAYSHLKKKDIRNLKKFLDKIIESSTMIKEATKAKRKKKKKSVSKEKKISKLKYLKEDAENALVSINPLDIIGAKELWLYNTKNRKLSKLVALDESGLDVKGTTILNVDESSSLHKTVKKPKDTLKRFKKAKANQLNKLFKEIKTVETTPNTRVNINHILLRVR